MPRSLSIVGKMQPTLLHAQLAAPKMRSLKPVKWHVNAADSWIHPQSCATGSDVSMSDTV